MNGFMLPASLIVSFVLAVLALVLNQFSPGLAALTGAVADDRHRPPLRDAGAQQPSADTLENCHALSITWIVRPRWAH